jgi:hypothetical protein
VDVLDPDLLLTPTAMAVKCFEQGRIRAGEFVGLSESLAPTLETLFGEHGAPVALHCSVVSRNQLCREHSLKFVARADADEGSDHCGSLFRNLVVISVSGPQCLNGLICEDIIELVGP